MEILKGKEQNQKANFEDEARRATDRSFVACSRQCFNKFTVSKVSINEERCLANCMTLRNHFFIDKANIMSEYIGAAVSSGHEHGAHASHK